MKKKRSHRRKGYTYKPGKEFRHSGSKFKSTEDRIIQRINSDELSENDLKFHLCRQTGKSYIELIRLAAYYKGNLTEFANHLHYTNLRRNNKYSDYCWWQTICAWMRIYIPWWETTFRKAIKKMKEDLDSITEEDKLVTTQNLEQFITNMAQLMNVEVSFLVGFIQNHQNIQQFLDNNRASLGTLAEIALWELLAKKDPATVRWALPRLNPAIWGEKLPGSGVNPGNINIVEGEIEKDE